jgi:hypothetical protein
LLWLQLHAVDPRWSADRVVGVFGARGARCGRGQWRSFVKLRFLGALGDGWRKGGWIRRLEGFVAVREWRAVAVTYMYARLRASGLGFAWLTCC